MPLKLWSLGTAFYSISFVATSCQIATVEITREPGGSEYFGYLLIILFHKLQGELADILKSFSIQIDNINNCGLIQKWNLVSSGFEYHLFRKMKQYNSNNLPNALTSYRPSKLGIAKAKSKIVLALFSLIR